MSTSVVKAPTIAWVFASVAYPRVRTLIRFSRSLVTWLMALLITYVRDEESRPVATPPGRVRESYIDSSVFHAENSSSFEAMTLSSLSSSPLRIPVNPAARRESL